MARKRFYVSDVDRPGLGTAPTPRRIPLEPAPSRERCRRALGTAVVLGLLLATGCRKLIPLLRPHRFDTLHPPAKLLADTARAVQLLQDIHPDPFRRISEQDFAVRVQVLRDSLTEPMTRREFAARLATFLAALGDGHTRVRFPEADYLAFQRAGGRVFPFTVRASDLLAGREGSTRLAITGTSSACDVPAPCELTAVNGMPAAELLRRLHTMTSGGDEAYRARNIGARFQHLLWLTGVEPPYRVSWTDAQHSAGTTLVAGATAAVNAPAEPAWRWYHAAPGVPCLEWTAMSGSGTKFQTFLRRLFQRLQRPDCRGLIIDLRQNSGGNSGFADLLLPYLTEKPYRLSTAKHWRLSTSYRKYAKRMGYRSARLKSTAADGRLHVFESAWRSPAPCPARYTGPLAVLVGPGTYSSAVMLADALREFGIGTLIGTATGGSPDGFGEICTVRLPETRLELDIATARFIGLSSASRDSTGVPPHRVVATDLASLLRDEDPVLEAAVAWVDKQTRPGR